MLHLLGNRRDLDTYPSVYNAMHLLAAAGFANIAALGSGDSVFDHLISRRHSFGGDIGARCAALSRITGRFEVIISYEPDDLIAYHLAPERPAGRYLAHHSLEVPDPVAGRSLAARLLASTSALGRGRGTLMQRLLAPRIAGITAGRIAREIAYAAALEEVGDLIVQDALRLSLITHFRPAKSFRQIGLVPNCYIGALEPKSVAPVWLDGIRGGFEHLVTYVGGIEEWAVDEDLLHACAACQDVKFMFSGWSRDGYAAKLVAMVEREGWKNICIDLSKKSDAELNAIVDASDAGLVYYASPSGNVMNTGLSSGKMHKFLGRGKPVVALDLPLMGSFIADNGFGATFANAGAGLAAALARILGDQPGFHEAIARRYPQLCSFEASYGKMIEGWRA
ncbi:MAG: hypothetical protein Q8M11_22445 [Sulfuritalea sp.]|nr:hypothetical protein [Sulfuritalea sp.]